MLKVTNPQVSSDKHILGDNPTYNGENKGTQLLEQKCKHKQDYNKGRQQATNHVGYQIKYCVWCWFVGTISLCDSVIRYIHINVFGSLMLFKNKCGAPLGYI
jgi:hypothetical protein